MGFGSALGGGIGSFFGDIIPTGLDGQAIGKTIGSWLPFKKGGIVLQPIGYAKMFKGGMATVPAKKKKYTKKKK